jgi:hypothetical protein
LELIGVKFIEVKLTKISYILGFDLKFGLYMNLVYSGFYCRDGIYQEDCIKQAELKFEAAT